MSDLSQMRTTRPERQYQESYEDFLARVRSWSNATRRRLMSQHPDQVRFEVIVRLREIESGLRLENTLLDEPKLERMADLLAVDIDELDVFLRALIDQEEK